MNGVWVNGTRISPNKPHALHEGDSVRLGVPLDGQLVEFDYVLIHSYYDEIKDFLSKSTKEESDANVSVTKPKRSKRKYETDPVDSADSKPKLFRTSNTDKSDGSSCPAAVPDHAQAGPSDAPGDIACASESGRRLASLQRYSKNLRALKEQIGVTQKRTVELQGQEGVSPERQEKIEVLQEQMELLHGELNSQQELAAQCMHMLERSMYEEERRLVVGLRFRLFSVNSR